MPLPPSVVYGRAALLDSSALVALLNPRDSRHSDIREQMESLSAAKWALFVPTLVIAETYRVLLYKAGVHKSVPLRFVEAVFDGSYNILRPSSEDESEAVGLLRRFGDQKLTLTDAVSMTMMKRLGLARAVTLDWHFSLLGFERLPPG
jgi:predicted nucleic acid-binding protein